MKIERAKYIIVRKLDGAVLCGTMKNNAFVPEDMIDKQMVKLYRSPETALAGAELAGYSRNAVRAEMVLEKIESVRGEGTA
jgi:hypothetical protein